MAALVSAVALVACGSSGAGGLTATPSTTAPAVRSRAPEPAVAPPVKAAPAGSAVAVGDQPEGLVVDGATHTAVVSVRGGATGDGVQRIDLTTGKVVGFTPTAGSARHLQLAAPGGPVLVPAEGSDTLYGVALATGAITFTARTGRQPHDAAPVGSDHVVVTDELADTVTVVAFGAGPGAATGAAPTATVGRRVPVPVQPGGIAGGTMADGSTPVALVVGVRGRQVEALGPTGESLGRAPAGEGPTHVRFADKRFYVADTSGNRILIYSVDRQGPHQVGSVPTGPGAPYGLAADPARGHLWVTLTGTNQLVEYRLVGTTLLPMRTTPTPRQPNDVAVDPSTGTVVVCGTGAATLEVLTP